MGVRPGQASPHHPLKPDFFPAGFPWQTGDPTGVGSIRFATAQDGFAFGPSLYSTHDGGQTWQNENRLVSEIAVAGGAIWAVEQQQTMALVERSIDAGRSWQPAPAQPAMNGWPALVAISAQTAWLYALGNGLDLQLMATSDGGTTWHENKSPLGARCASLFLRAIAPEHLWFICVGPGATSMQTKQVYTSSDGGISWQLQANNHPLGPTTGQITIMGGLYKPANFVAASASSAFMVLDRGNMIMTVDSGHTWRDAIPYDRVSAGGDPILGPVAFANADNGWFFVSPDRLFRTTDGGQHWSGIHCALADHVPGSIFLGQSAPRVAYAFPSSFVFRPSSRAHNPHPPQTSGAALTALSESSNTFFTVPGLSCLSGG